VQQPVAGELGACLAQLDKQLVALARGGRVAREVPAQEHADALLALGAVLELGAHHSAQ
jgi:hypothetical protein